MRASSRLSLNVHCTSCYCTLILHADILFFFAGSTGRCEALWGVLHACCSMRICSRQGILSCWLGFHPPSCPSMLLLVRRDSTCRTWLQWLWHWLYSRFESSIAFGALTWMPRFNDPSIFVVRGWHDKPLYFPMGTAQHLPLFPPVPGSCHVLCDSGLGPACQYGEASDKL